ncbi:hypothetical protein [Altericroceibacterium spongiae]|nr:hypothetical protein [Altericroceibacterium spongiae]
MADKTLSPGDIFSSVSATIAANSQVLGLYVLFFAIATSLADLLTFSVVSAAGSLLQFVLTVLDFLAQYLLIETMLKQARLSGGGTGRRYLAFLGLSILTSLGIALGLLLLIIPGLILAARWSLVYPLLIGGYADPMDCFAESNRLTKEHEVPIILAGLILIVPLAVIIGLLFAVGSDVGGVLLSTLIPNLLLQCVSVISLALPVALFALLGPQDEQLTEVFN